LYLHAIRCAIVIKGAHTVGHRSSSTGADAGAMTILLPKVTVSLANFSRNGAKVGLNWVSMLNGIALSGPSCHVSAPS
jgi:hypothetical protein